VNQGTFEEVARMNSDFAEQAKHFGITFDWALIKGRKN
jgi:hypothetical protein